MSPEERRSIERECAELIVALTHCSDHDERQRAVELFTPDGVWIRGGKPYVGRAEMLQSFAGSATAVTRHMTSNIRVAVKDDRTAAAVTYYVAYRHDPGAADAKLPLPLSAPFSMGEWHDSFTRTPEGWRFTRREVKRLFQRSGDR